MKKKAIHQFHSGSAYGDAITNSMLLIKDMLCRLGFVSEIYVEHVAPELAEEINYYKKLKPNPQDLILIHHSMGHDLLEWILSLPGKKILVYHNITPAHFFPETSPQHYYSIIGRDQLIKLLPAMESAICVSRFNADELLGCGYGDVHVIPLLLHVDALLSRQWDHTIVAQSSNVYTLLFVGRISPNKCQEDLIRVALYLKNMMDLPFQLVLVGGYSEDDPYYCQLLSLVNSFGLKTYVRFTGKVSDAELYGWYRSADLFLCMSEHEGFGVPLIEAMAFDVPVVAYKSSNISNTMGGAGILVTEKDHKSIAALVKIISMDRALKRAIVRGQRCHISNFTKERLENQLSAFLTEQGFEIPEHETVDDFPGSHGLAYLVEGPFETSYSLALVNREIAFALDRIEPGCAGLFATEGPGDYEPDVNAIRSIPGLETLWEKGTRCNRADVVVRNIYPPRVSDMDGQINMLYFAWEESMLPHEWTQAFNRHLDGLPVLSEFIKKILTDNGVSVPAIAAGCGVDHLDRLTPLSYPLKVKAGFRFLHISSCFPRKGVDLLLRAFAETFSTKDDVCLVIKTFPNLHNNIEGQVKEIRAGFPGCPPIEIINRDLAFEEILDIYHNCHALVAPSRGEGFGLPMAEAMWCGLPVITTAYGGQSDFCDEKTCWPIDFSFKSAKSHMNLFNSVWMEPDVNHLGVLMGEVYHATSEELQPRLKAARKLMESDFTWERCANRLKTLQQRIGRIKPGSRKKNRIGWISSWNCKCGIATYSKFLVDALVKEDNEVKIFASVSDTKIVPDTPNVFRCWIDCGGEVDELLETMAREPMDAIVLQFNFGFFSTLALERMVEFTQKQGIVFIIFFHSTVDVDRPEFKASLSPISKTLAGVDRLLVHGVEDLNRFKSWGLYTNVAIFPHGVLNRKGTRKGTFHPWDKTRKGTFHPWDKTLPFGQSIARGETSPVIVARGETSPVIATYGFMLPHKGLEQLIEAFAILRPNHPDLKLEMVNALYPVSVSEETRLRCLDLIEKHGLENSVTMVTDFLEDEQSLALLDKASMIVFPYQETAESASGAIRYGLATHRPVVCTPLDIFSDVVDLVHQLPGTRPEDIAAGIDRLLVQPRLLEARQKVQDQWLVSHSWAILGKRLNGIIKSILNEVVI